MNDMTRGAINTTSTKILDTTLRIVFSGNTNTDINTKILAINLEIIAIIHSRL